MLHTARIGCHDHERVLKFEHVSPCLTFLTPIVYMDDIRGARSLINSLEYGAVQS